ncbi:MAG: FRG domain-containing protein [Puniceicoccales bacterium]
MNGSANEIEINSWAELQEVLFADAWDGDLERHRSRNAYRGMADRSQNLITSLMRLGGPFVELERHLLRNFRKYAHRSVVERDSLWHWLAVAQHYGLPTRLLDWTYSPYVALHFATADISTFDRDGAIWALNYVRVHELLPEQLTLRLREEGANVFTTEMLYKTIGSFEELAGLQREPFLLFLEPPSIDDRIVNQFAFFSVASDPALCLDEWLRQRPDMWSRVIIPAKLKWEIRDKLDQANITERVLLPGLEGLSRWLTRHYSPKLPSTSATGDAGNLITLPTSRSM